MSGSEDNGNIGPYELIELLYEANRRIRIRMRSPKGHKREFSQQPNFESKHNTNMT